jgi:hypothetical protein
MRCSRAAGLAVALLPLTFAAVRAAPRAGGSLAGGGEQAYSVQLHIHGPVSENNGSIDWHVQKAHEIGVDVIWWTDHDWRASQLYFTPRYDFENCVWNASPPRFVEPDVGFEERWWEVYQQYIYHAKSIVDTVSYEGAKSLRLEVWDPVSDPEFWTLDLVQTGTRKQNRYSLASDFRLRFALLPEQLDPANARFVFQVTLSEHPADWPRLRYVVGSMDGEDATSIPLAWVPGAWNAFDLDVTGDARALLGGFGADSIRAEDNSTYEFHAELSTREGSHPIVFLDDVRYETDPSLRGNALLDWQRAAGSYYELQVPDVHHLVGSEISLFKSQPHLNAYAPGHTLIDYGTHSYLEPLDYAVEQVHEQGGLVSYNHPWGIGIYGDLHETPEQKQQRILAAKLSLLANGLLGCDMIEAGYRWRHGINLAGHLDLWDCLTANAMFKTGIGVTDSHGSTPFYGWAPWQPSATYENNYVTWLWATDVSEGPLLDALAGGRAYFGDPYRWQGELDLASLDGFPMGRVVLTDKGSHEVVVRVTNVPSGVDVRLAQAEIREDPPTSYTTVNWLRQESLGGAVVDGVFADTVTVDVALPSFVRVEVWNGTAEWAFSNPLAFVHDVPAAGVPAPRVAASLDAIRILDAETLVLRDASFDAGASTLALLLDEGAPGLGRLELAVEALGAPAQVEGCGSWSYDAGELVLDGFAGAGSAVTVSWSGVQAPFAAAEAPARLSLSPGRPNPFGRGLTADFALPDPGQALLEVLDVGGRRVRILRDEWTPAGPHRATWDGLDHYGRPVADGVYFLRLRTLGSTLTTKAVKVR